MFKRNPYVWTGLSLLVAGSLVALSAYYLLSATWLTALGICLLVLGLVLLALGRTVPSLSPQVSALLLETGIDNIAAIAEELGIRSKAIYLPSSLTGGRPRALIPLRSTPLPPALTRALPQRLIVRYGARPDDIGLLLSTIGSTAIGMLEAKPVPSPAGIQEALTSLFSGILGVADGVTVMSEDNHIRVEINHPRIEDRASWSHQGLGGPLASIVAAVAAEARDKPVTISQQDYKKGKYTVELEVAG